MDSLKHFHSEEGVHSPGFKDPPPIPGGEADGVCIVIDTKQDDASPTVGHGKNCLGNVPIAVGIVLLGIFAILGTANHSGLEFEPVGFAAARQFDERLDAASRVVEYSGDQFETRAGRGSRETGHEGGAGWLLVCMCASRSWQMQFCPLPRHRRRPLMSGMPRWCVQFLLFKMDCWTYQTGAC